MLPFEVRVSTTATPEDSSAHQVVAPKAATSVVTTMSTGFTYGAA
jgi:hypothetical protein